MICWAVLPENLILLEHHIILFIYYMFLFYTFIYTFILIYSSIRFNKTKIFRRNCLTYQTIACLHSTVRVRWLCVFKVARRIARAEWREFEYHTFELRYFVGEISISSLVLLLTASSPPGVLGNCAWWSLIDKRNWYNSRRNKISRT